MVWKIRNINTGPNIFRTVLISISFFHPNRKGLPYGTPRPIQPWLHQTPSVFPADQRCMPTFLSEPLGGSYRAIPDPMGDPVLTSAKRGTDFRAYFIKKILKGMLEILPCLWGWIVIVPIHTRSSWCVRQQRCWGRSEVFVSFPKSPNPLEANPPSSCALEQAAAH